MTDAILATTLTQWVDGSETPVLDRKGDLPRNPTTAIWTTTPHFQYPELLYGDSNTPGARYLRIGFKNPVLVGSVLVHGGGQLSILKPGAAYPGNLNDETQWIPAQRINGVAASTDEVGSGHDALWVLPAVTSTRALRFAHVARLSDPIYGGTFGGAYVLSTRLANLATQAVATTRSESQNAGRINDETDNGWGAWENIPATGDRPRTIADDPEWVMLTWAHPVTIVGLASLGRGFSGGDVQTYIGPSGEPLSVASEVNWKSIRTFSGWKSLYPGILQADWIDFGRQVTTTAIRLRISMVLDENGIHPHLIGKTRSGRRVWLDELMALKSLHTNALATVIPKTSSAPSSDALHAPIAINFTMPEDGFATLVIDDSNGKRIRNLISDGAFRRGRNTIYWDGTDDLKRDLDAANHGLYNVPAEYVTPGTYMVRGLWHRKVDLNYELSVYSPGEPPWPTLNSSGGWMTNHTPASSAVFIQAQKAPGGQPLIGLGAYISEGGSAFSWVSLEGKKIGGRGWIGGNWTGAQYLASDSGSEAEKNVAAYVGSAFEPNGPSGKVEIRLTQLTTLVTGGDQPVLKNMILLDPVRSSGTPTNAEGSGSASPTRYLGGLAVWNGLLVMSETSYDKLIFIDAKAGKVIGEAAVPRPGVLAFDSEGRLLLISGTSLFRYSPAASAGHILTSPETLITGLEDPQGITVDATDEIFIADRGSSNQVKVFSSSGRPISTIGTPGPSKAGPYDPLHMNQPKGLAIDSNNRIWVTEESFQPKRVSVWNSDGTLWKAFYGPAQYGGGGALDPEDNSRFSYNGMEFHIDWKNGTSTLQRVYYRLDDGEFKLPSGSAAPEMALRFNGRRYMTNAFNSNPTNGSQTAFLFLDNGDVVVPVAAIGTANDWNLLKGDSFRSIWPTGVDLNGDRWKNQAMFVWSDTNGDGQVQPNEVEMWPSRSGGVTVANDGSFVVNDVASGNGPGHVERFRPLRFTKGGAPVISHSMEILGDSQGAVSTGGNQALVGANGWTVETNAPPPYSPYSLGGLKDGVALWSYPSLWPGLHASHNSPPPDHPGELIGTTRLLGDFVTPRNSDAGPLFFINGNQGNIYVFTQDGIFVTQLFQDVRQGSLWEMPKAQRHMLLNDLTLHDENFFPSVSQVPDGSIYLDSGSLSALVKVNGLESIRRLPPISVNVNINDLKAAADSVARREMLRQGIQTAGILDVALRSQAPPMDANPDAWSVPVDWVPIDVRGVAAYFDSHNQPYNVQGGVTIAGGKLFAVWKTGDPQLLRNSGENEIALFKTGGALDLMIGTDPSADPKRTQPVAGDLRLLITQVNGQTTAILYREVVPGTPTNQKIMFSAPWHSIAFDSVSDVSKRVELVVDGKGNFEVAVPLDLLGLKPRDGQTIKGDIGILRGHGVQTTQRVYWNNKGTAIVSDIPSEAHLTPSLWGIWAFQAK